MVVLDVTDISPVCDFFVLANGTSDRQMRSVADDLAELGESLGYRPLSRNGYEHGGWILLDFVDVLVHVFTDEARSYYDLDGLWGDAKRIEWRPPT